MKIEEVLSPFQWLQKPSIFVEKYLILDPNNVYFDMVICSIQMY